jgi:hypothetical protein
MGKNSTIFSPILLYIIQHVVKLWAFWNCVYAKTELQLCRSKTLLHFDNVSNSRLPKEKNLILGIICTSGSWSSFKRKKSESRETSPFLLNRRRQTTFYFLFFSLSPTPGGPTMYRRNYVYYVVYSLLGVPVFSILYPKRNSLRYIV